MPSYVSPFALSPANEPVEMDESFYFGKALDSKGRTMTFLSIRGGVRRKDVPQVTSSRAIDFNTRYPQARVSYRDGMLEIQRLSPRHPLGLQRVVPNPYQGMPPLQASIEAAVILLAGPAQQRKRLLPTD